MMFRQFLTESVALALLGGGAGLLLAVWGVRVLIALSPDPTYRRVETVGVDGHVLLFALGISLLTGLAFGIAPAWKATAVNLSDALKEGERGSSEGCIATVCVVSCGFRICPGGGAAGRSGADGPHLSRACSMWIRALIRTACSRMVVGVAGTEQAAAGHTGNFYREVLQKVSAVPGVESASGINHLPLAGDEWGFPFYIEGASARALRGKNSSPPTG